jgi:hypothetical protein
MRPAFSMLMALAVIVIVSTISVLVLNLSGKMVTGTTAKYREEQAALLANSYAELAILSVINQDINSSCITELNSTVDNLVPNGSASLSGDAVYRVNVQISYLGNDLNACDSNHILNNGATIATDYNTTLPAGLAAVIIDVFVRYRNSEINPDHDLTYHLRRLNKI